ncbi:MAG: radical SAM protein [Kosmotoga sp.]|uniref:radical SAM protein n=2 Tax=Kosmotoga sp. TaxID=1955248 RepID=UPI001D3582FE|nr:radical SAM protein [Kosmotoga sp.]MBO8166839.1 radical SAM protein [Kosmotoga sp.]
MRDFTFVFPSSTRSISTSGLVCALNCKHCGGHYLQGMGMVAEIPQLLNAGKKSFLISGGLNGEAAVPWKDHAEFLLKIKRDYPVKYNFHVGPVVKSEDIPLLKELADIVSFDIVGDAEVMKEVYGEDLFRASVKSFNLLIENDIKIIPHITIGLKEGVLSHEFKALELLEKAKMRKVVFLVFIPTVGTAYAKKSPPEIKDVELVFKEAGGFRKILGCMHPGGGYRRKLQNLALSSGFDAIVQPIKPTIDTAKGLNLNSTYFYECCGFLL